ncbi:MAG: cytochrome c1 [Gammaproteobacteria bacterium]|nr:cytochrome c1 [Gammaproteobacteria bacterium]|tara:strand:+ start:982 stop:1737 length:756 start_codon:yes stop_codon:yes gene_type:complete
MARPKVINSLLIATLYLFSVPGLAASSGVELESADIDSNSISSLQRGAANFMNYCSGCHSAKYVRYQTIGKDLDLSEDILKENLMFNAQNIFDTIQTSMSNEDAALWYGTAPPDLSLMARAKGVDYIFNFLKGFYVDSESPTGVDNIVLPGTSMPHVLWELQGHQSANFESHKNIDGSETISFSEFKQISPGIMDSEDYEEFVRDTVNFLSYISEPVRGFRITLGKWVIAYLIFFLILARMLKKQIWRDVK